MSDDGAQLIFSELLERHGRIRVPLIQRDYAQGRIEEDEVRNEFLAALHEALLLLPESDRLPLNLDFIYGSVEDKNGFQPLDGQQRLTTLFLLHWYLSWRDECSEAFRDLCMDGAASRFSYQVRPSSKEFFDQLVGHTPSQTPDEVEKVSALLQDQPWYFRSWRLDPTIQSALVMLDALHERFQDTHGLYARLTDTEQPAITFQLLDLRNFGLSDDLYIKMNARGKPLTSFETFKARYEQILRDQFPDETRLIDGVPVSASEYFSRRMDTRWADFFWPHRDPETHVFDEAVMNVFRAVILITRSPKSELFDKDITDLRYRWQKNSYPFFQQRNWLDAPFFETLVCLLDIWSGGEGGLIPKLPDERYFKEESVLKQILSEPSGLDYDDIVQFAAYAQFLKKHEDAPDPAAFQEWMRVVFNLSVNTEYNRPADLQRSLSELANLAPHMTTILEYLAGPESDIGGFNRQQVAEERLKARLLLTDDGWRALIDQAEGHGYFQGQIGFLLRFSGVSSHPAATGDQEWMASETRGLQQAFSDYLRKAAAMFGNRGLNSLPDHRWERALLSLGDYMLEARLNHSFLVDSQTDPVSWKRLLRDAASGTQQGDVLRRLWDKLSGSENLIDQLDEVISGASVSEVWRAALIETPAAIEYCGMRRIRHEPNGVIYLLRKIQLNGAHAELFTYCLYQNILKSAKIDGRLRTLTPYYDETTSSDDPPGVWLKGNCLGESTNLFIQFQSGTYIISLWPQEALPEQLSQLLLDLGFAPGENGFHKHCQTESIETDILELDQYMTKAGAVATHA